MHDLPISVNDRVISAFREILFSRNFAYAKFRENKTVAKIFQFTVYGAQLDQQMLEIEVLDL